MSLIIHIQTIRFLAKTYLLPLIPLLITELLLTIYVYQQRHCIVKPIHTGMPWVKTFIPVWTGSGLERVFASGEEQTTITCTIDIRVIIQDVSSVGLQMIGGCIQIN